MTIPTANVSLGNLGVQSIRKEFGPTSGTPVSLYAFRRGGAFVVAGQGNAGYGIISAGTPISMGPFRNQSAAPPSYTFTETVTTNFFGGYNLRTRAMTPFVGSNGSTAWDGSSALIATVTVNSGVYVIGTNFLPGWSTGTSFIPPGSSITLVNYGIIGGLGGNGGTGGTAHDAALTDGTNGGAGGTGVYSHSTLNMYNYGTIAAGGGGGGGGGAAYLDLSYVDPKSSLVVVAFQDASGGGGGGGRANGFAGANGSVSTSGGAAYGPDVSPTNASLFAPGSGSSSGNVGPYGPDNGPGGAGGQFGQPGFAGGNSGGEATARSAPGGGGAAGQAVFGGFGISWYVFGTRIGAIDNPGTNMAGGGVSGSYNGTVVDRTRLTNVAATTQARALFLADGSCLGTSTPSPPDTNTLSGTNWFSPITPGIGGSYWIRGVLQSGLATNQGDALNVWHSLATTRTFGQSVTALFTVRSGNVQFQIATDSAGSNVVVTGNILISSANDF